MPRRIIVSESDDEESDLEDVLTQLKKEIGRDEGWKTVRRDENSRKYSVRPESPRSFNSDEDTGSQSTVCEITATESEESAHFTDSDEERSVIGCSSETSSIETARSKPSKKKSNNKKKPTQEPRTPPTEEPQFDKIWCYRCLDTRHIQNFSAAQQKRYKTKGRAYCLFHKWGDQTNYAENLEFKVEMLKRQLQQEEAEAKAAAKRVKKYNISGTEIISFGHYEGKSFEEVRCGDKSYCAYVLRQNHPPSPAFKRFRNYLKDCMSDEEVFVDYDDTGFIVDDKVDPNEDFQLNDPHGNEVFQRTKHRGKTFEEVRRSDLSFCKWAVKLVHSGGQLERFREYLLSQDDSETYDSDND